VEDITLLREQYRCPHFRILVIGRANAGKTTILEKVCGVAKGTQPIIIHDKMGKLDESPLQCPFSYSVLSRQRTGTF
jgi:GTPase SAR1 family protein